MVRQGLFDPIRWSKAPSLHGQPFRIEDTVRKRWALYLCGGRANVDEPLRDDGYWGPALSRLRATAR